MQNQINRKNRSWRPRTPHIVTGFALLLGLGLGALVISNLSDTPEETGLPAKQLAVTAPEGYSFSNSVHFATLPLSVRESVVTIDIDCFPSSIPLSSNEGPGGWTFVMQTAKDSDEAPKGTVIGYLNIFEDNYQVVQARPEQSIPSVHGPALTNMCITSKWRGRRLAVPFIRYALTTYAAAHPDKDWIYLDVATKDTAAIAAYKRTGFEEVMKLANETIVMRRDLRTLR
jgi:hypothetical protein